MALLDVLALIQSTVVWDCWTKVVLPEKFYLAVSHEKVQVKQTSNLPCAHKNLLT